MNAPATQFPVPSSLDPQVCAKLLELLEDLGVFELEFERARCVKRAAIGSIENFGGSGVACWNVHKREDLELSPEEFHALVPFCDENGKHPVDLAKGEGPRGCEVTHDGQSRIVQVRATEHLQLKVLTLTIGNGEYRALVELQGAGEYQA